MNIHPTAIVADRAKLADGVTVGPFSIIGPEVEIGSGCTIGAHVILEHRVVIGEGTKVGHGTILGEIRRLWISTKPAATRGCVSAGTTRSASM